MKLKQLKQFDGFKFFILEPITNDLKVPGEVTRISADKKKSFSQKESGQRTYHMNLEIRDALEELHGDYTDEDVADSRPYYR
jgi:hypothetical protein